MFVKGQPKIAGRKKGTPNKKTVKRQQLINSLKASGKDPLSFFGDILSNETAPFSLRFDAAKEMLPYMHPRLASIESRRGGKTHEERLAEARERLARRNSLHLTRADAIDLEMVIDASNREPQEGVELDLSNGSHPEPRGGVNDPTGGGGGG